MRGITLSEEFVNQIVGKTAGKVSESTEASQTEAHVCPLCESHLEEPISDEKIEEHVEYFLDISYENFEIVGDSLDEEEAVEEEGSEELDESGEVGDEAEEELEDVDEASCGSKMKPGKGKVTAKNQPGVAGKMGKGKKPGY